jgi:DNA-binding XRE family transcriptional regulator
MGKAVEQILAGSPAQAVAAVRKIAGATVEEIEGALPGAIAGNRRQLDAYLGAVNLLIERLLKAAAEAKPDTARSAVPAQAMLQGGAINAPFSPWVGAMGPGKGVALAMVALLRQTLPETDPLAAPPRRRPPDWNLDDRDVLRFYRDVACRIERAELPLERVRRVLDLSRTELAALFGVSRQAVEKWEAQGIPADRAEKLATIGAIADLLEAQLKADRIAAIARRTATAYGDRSIVEAIAAGEEDLVLSELRKAFDWAASA